LEILSQIHQLSHQPKLFSAFDTTKAEKIFTKMEDEVEEKVESKL
jgi:hypothetical protein